MLALLSTLMFVMIFTSACTFYGEHPAKTMEEATGGEGLERVFWKNVQASNWVEVERALASNYTGVTPSGTIDRAAALEQYRSWQLKDQAIGDLKTEMNGSTIVVTYNITLNGTAEAQSLCRRRGSSKYSIALRIQHTIDSAAVAHQNNEATTARSDNTIRFRPRSFARYNARSASSNNRSIC